MSRRHADIWSHPDHYLVDPYTWLWSPNGHGHEWPTPIQFVQCQSALPFWDTAILKFDHENPWSRTCMWSEVKVTFDLENSKFKVMVKVKLISHIWGLEFIRYVCFSFRGKRTTFGWDICSKFHIWPWRFTVKVSARSNPMVTFESIFLRFVSGQSDHFWLIYSKFHIWPWKFKLKVTTKIDQILIRYSTGQGQQSC